MSDFSDLDRCLKAYQQEIKTWSPDRLLQVNLELLQRLDLLNFFHAPPHESAFTQYFQVAETPDKITLLNDDFIIWIVPELVDMTPVTYTFIALNDDGNPELELTFVTKGVYNSSKLVMRVLEKLLVEIKENEDLLTRYEGL